MRKISLPAAAIATALTLISCDSGDDLPKGNITPVPDRGPPITKTERTITATKAAQKTALDRLAVMQKITETLKPLRDPEAALAAKPQLEELFSQYHGLTAEAAAEGLKNRPLAEVTAHLAKDTWQDSRTEFMQYTLLIKQLGEPQRAMMERLMTKPEAQ